MNSNFLIKPASINDVPIILTLIKELAEYEKLSHIVQTTEEMLRKNLFGDEPQAEVILGYVDDVPVAMSIFFHNFSTFEGVRGLYIEDLYVKPEMRGRGLGKQMLQYLGKIAQERNCARMEWSVLDWNTPAIEFYKSVNAKPMDEWTVFRLTKKDFEKL